MSSGNAFFTRFRDSNRLLNRSHLLLLFPYLFPVFTEKSISVFTDSRLPFGENFSKDVTFVAALGDATIRADVSVRAGRHRKGRKVKNLPSLLD
ncbi:hypothetical protein CDAR_387051 [Caerostris darwini]|uniref:Uncharacterized protein n=1 Tax=Caerostris darwini TaxID=1538125 RepID=A0AAV4RQF1_9ARAC|nr:hypothetical protein CDAR_387051 [Caerostris darwini]